MDAAMSWPPKLKVLELGYMVAAMSLPPALRRGDLSKVADGITELCDSESSVFLTASGGRVVCPCP